MEWVVVSPKVWCCPPPLYNQVVESRWQFFGKYVWLYCDAFRESLLLKCTQLKIQQFHYFKIQGERKTENFKKIGKFNW